MKKIITTVLFAIFAVTVAMTHDVKESAAKKIPTKKSSNVDIVRGKTYKFSELTKEAKDPWKKKENLYKALKGKSVKWSCGSKKVKITKNTLRVKKAGRYKVIAKTRKRAYVLPVTVVKKVTTKTYAQIYVTYDEKYKMSDIIKDAKLSEDIEGESVTWTASSKEVVMGDGEFCIKKTGDYRLIGTTRTHKYIIPITVAEKSVKHDVDSSRFSEVRYMTISSSAMGRKMVTITDSDEMTQIFTKLVEAEYVFDYELTQCGGYTLGGIPYSLQFYTAEGGLLCNVVPSRIARGNYYYVQPNNVFSDYVRDLFLKYYDDAVEMP